LSADLIEDIVDWIVRVVSGLGFFLPIAIFFLINLFTGDKKKNQKQAAPGTPQRTGRPTAPQVRPQTEPAPQPQRPPPETIPFPLDPSMWTAPQTASPTPDSRRARQDDPYRRADREDAYRHQDDTLQWGSAFAANDREKRASAFKWGSVFDEERERSKWGWDENEWGGGYAPKRDSEPKITVG
jgi:hypothetical protein